MDIRRIRAFKAAALGFAVTAAFMASTMPTASASFTFNFAQTGTGAGTPIQGFNESAGNALAVGGNAAVAAGPGSTFQLYFQSTIGNLVGPPPSGSPIGITGQLTIVGSITEVILPGSTPSVALFGVASAADQASHGSSVSMFFNPTAVANPLAGTGFNVGTLVMSATPVPSAQGNLNTFTINAGSGPFDGLVPTNYPGITSVNGSGVSTIDFNTTFINPAFFPTGGPTIVGLHLGAGGANTPFSAVEPSRTFAEAGHAGAPAIGTINGAPYNGTNPDFQFQTTGTITAVPEPSSVCLTALGLVGVLAYVRRKRIQNV